MKKRNVVTQAITFLTIFVLAGMIFSSASFADYGTVIQSSLCGSGGRGESTGGNPSNNTEGTGNGYNYDQGDNTWSGYDHDVGLKYLKIGKKSSDRWKGSKVWPINQIPEKRKETFESN